MRRKLYGNHIEPACEVCSYGRRSTDGNVILCKRRGVVPLYYSCRKFDYDPLKRVPKRLPQMQEFSKDDFEI